MAIKVGVAFAALAMSAPSTPATIAFTTFMNMLVLPTT
jgi:hypothetical protein